MCTASFLAHDRAVARVPRPRRDPLASRQGARQSTVLIGCSSDEASSRDSLADLPRHLPRHFPIRSERDGRTRLQLAPLPRSDPAHPAAVGVSFLDPQ